MSKQMKITISPLGIPKVEMVGYNGIGCQDRSKRTLDALSGGKGGEVNLKPEANMIETESSDEAEMTL